MKTQGQRGAVWYPRALQTHEGWAQRLDGREARVSHRAGGARALLTCCMRDRNGRAAKVAALAANGFPQGPAQLHKDKYTEVGRKEAEG